MKGTKEDQMLDFTEGWTWFATGLATTLFFAALVVAFGLLAGRVDDGAAGSSRRPQGVRPHRLRHRRLAGRSRRHGRPSASAIRSGPCT